MIGVVIGGVGAHAFVIFQQSGVGVHCFVYAFIVWFIWAFLAMGIESRDDRSRLSRFGALLPLPYDWVMERVLKGLPRLLLPRTAAQYRRPESGIHAKFNWYTTPMARDAADLDRLARRPWSWPVLDAAMWVAIVYPILFAGVQWALSGKAADLGGVTVLEAGIHPVLGWALIAGLGTLVAARFLVSATGKGIYGILSYWLSALTTILILGLVLALGVSGIYLFSFALLGIFIVAAAVGGASSFACAFMVALSAVLVMAFDLVGVVGNILSLSLSLSLSLLLIVGVAAAFAVASVALLCGATRIGKGLYGYAALLIMCFVVSIVAILIAPIDRPQFAILVVALVLLPVVNAVFDWLSYGLTIWLLRLGYRKRGIAPLLGGLADAGAALLLFFALSFTLLALLAGIDGARVVPLFDVPGLLADVRERPGQVAWLLAMVASTLLPTLVHLSIGVLSIVTWFPGKMWAALTVTLDPGRSVQLPLIASLALTFALLIYALVPGAILYGVGWLIWSCGEEMRLDYADRLEGALRAFGLI